MPTYQVMHTEGAFDDAQKQAIAEVITNCHSDVTGTPTHLAEVFLHAMAPSTHFIGGRPAVGHNIFVLGHTRAGRSSLEKYELTATIRDRLSERLDLPTSRIWIYITEIPAKQMIEFGAFLPEPGDEHTWEDGMPADALEVMRAYR